MRILLTITLVSVWLAACGQEDTREPKVSESERIEALYRHWADLEVDGDLEAWLDLVADDAVLQPPGEPSVHGKKAIKAYAVNFFELPITIMEPDNLTVFVSESNELATISGDLKMVLENPDSQSEHSLKFLVVWRRVDGVWKVAANSWSANNP